jgi:hypothetical protein
MTRTPLSWVGSVVVATATAAGLSASLAGQSQPTPASTGAAAPKATPAAAIPRMPDGHPDLQGTYDVATMTPIERPANVQGRRTLTEAEAAAIERAERTRVFERALPSDGNRPAPAIGAPVGGYNNFWIDRGSTVIRVDGVPRSSIITDPPDGKIPALTAEGKQRAAALRVRNGANPEDNQENLDPAAINPNAYNDPEQRPLGERCLLGFGSTSGPPTLPNYFYNNLKQIVQTKDMIVILVEMDHDARMIRMNQPHLPPTARKWMGDSVGHWEGDTLVVDTTNFTDKTRFRGSSDSLHVVEKFSRVDDRTLMYRFTIDDPHTWVGPWTGEYPWPATDQPLYEYACHEGNYALADILSGARASEKDAAAKSNSGKRD